MARWALSTDERFWSHVQKSDGCWLWSGGANACGYGRTLVGPRRVLAHRRMWELTNGPIPDGLYVCHTCDVRRCVNPAHLWLGTNEQNIADRDRKGRQYDRRGERGTNTKLTTAQVVSIRQATGHRIISRLSREFGVGRTQVKRIRDGQSWRDHGLTA